MNWKLFVAALTPFEREGLVNALRVTNDMSELLPFEYAMVKTGRMIDAIKSVRQRTGLTLLECRKLVDAVRYPTT